MIVYHGTVHYANQHEMLSLYLGGQAAAAPRARVRLVRLGETELGGVDPRSLGALREGVVELGSVGWREIPGYLALADAFVQPGAPDDFNRYRLPSKLPEFLAMGRPVMLPDCNIGHDLADGREALLLSTGDGLEIAARLEQLLDDAELRGRLAAGAREFALSQLDWERNSLALGRFLNRVAGVAASPRAHAGGGLTMARPPLSGYARRAARRRAGACAPASDRRPGPARDARRRRQRLGRGDRRPASSGRCASSTRAGATSTRSRYGTVRDFADSTETMPGLASASADMKSAQRCWMVKAVLASVPRGGRLVEIGAGEPLVAGLLSRLGYEVIVVDPYDGSGNGPREYAPLHEGLPGPALRPRPVPARGGPRRPLRLRLLDLGPRARPARGDRRGDRGRGADPARRARRLLDPRRRPCARGLGRRHPSRAGSSGSSPPPSSTASELAAHDLARWSSTPRPTWSPPRPTTSGAARSPTTRTRCAASARSTSSGRY